MPAYGVHGEYQKVDLTLNARDEFSNPNRSRTISIFSLDPTLRKDIVDRLQYEPRLAGHRIRSTGEENIKKAIGVLKDMAGESRADRIMIMDARRATLTLLRPVFNRVVTLNRRDFSRYAFSVVIADGPGEFLKPGKSLDVFIPYLMELKRDFVQSLFFYDPLLHYQSFETMAVTMDDDWRINDHLPDRLKKELISKKLIGEADHVKVKHIRKHFRGFKEGQADDALRQKRMAEFLDIVLSRIHQTFPDNPAAASWPTKEGYRLEGYGPMYMYPFFFEQLVADLLEKHVGSV
jgi:hypothetical protein